MVGNKSKSVKLPPELSRYYIDKRKVLGSGGFAKVILAQHIPTGEQVAIKVMDKNYLKKKGDLDRAYNEIYALKHLAHKHICKLYESFENKDFVFIVMEHFPDGELYNYIESEERLCEDEARRLFRQIVDGVSFIHENGYAHRDLKPENMLLDKEKNVKIIDFGLSAKPKDGLDSPLKTRVGSALYVSPELISGKPYYGNKTDIWSLGVVLYALLCGSLPFTLVKRDAFVKPPYLSQESIEVLSDMLEVNPSKRITMDKLKKHKWMTIGGLEPIPPTEPVKKEQLDFRSVQLTSAYFNWSLAATEAKISKFTYNHLTAFYFIVYQMPDEKFRRFFREWLHRDNYIGEANHVKPFTLKFEWFKKETVAKLQEAVHCEIS